MNIYLATLDQEKELNYEFASNRYGWIQMIKGEIEVNNIIFERGDGVSISEISQLNFKAALPSQFVFFGFKLNKILCFLYANEINKSF